MNKSGMELNEQSLQSSQSSLIFHCWVESSSRKRLIVEYSFAPSNSEMPYESMNGQVSKLSKEEQMVKAVKVVGIGSSMMTKDKRSNHASWFFCAFIKINLLLHDIQSEHLQDDLLGCSFLGWLIQKFVLRLWVSKSSKCFQNIILWCPVEQYSLLVLYHMNTKQRLPTVLPFLKFCKRVTISPSQQK